MFERRRSLAATALLLAFAGCDSPSGAPRATAPARMEVVSGDLQQFTVGELLPERLVVRIADSDGRPVSNQLVNFRVAAGDGSVLAGAGVTDAEGLAQDSWTLGPAAGDSQRVEVRAVDRSTGNV